MPSECLMLTSEREDALLSFVFKHSNSNDKVNSIYKTHKKNPDLIKDRDYYMLSFRSIFLENQKGKTDRLKCIAILVIINY